jgi:hypothetical protein
MGQRHRLDALNGGVVDAAFIARGKQREALSRGARGARSYSRPAAEGLSSDFAGQRGKSCSTRPMNARTRAGRCRSASKRH